MDPGSRWPETQPLASVVVSKDRAAAAAAPKRPPWASQDEGTRQLLRDATWVTALMGATLAASRPEVPPPRWPWTPMTRPQQAAAWGWDKLTGSQQIRGRAM